MRLIVLLGFLVSTSVFAAPANRCGEFEKAVATGTAQQKYKRFLDAQWKYFMTEYPTWATYVGYPGQDDRWTDNSIAANERRDRETLCMRNVLKKIPRTALPAKERVNYDLSLYGAELYVEGMKFPDEYMPISHLDGVQNNVSDTVSAMPRNSVKAYENILKRYEGLPLLISQNQDLMREGLKRKVTPVKAFLGKVPPQIDALVTDKVEDSPLYEPFKEFPKDFTADDQTRLRARAKEILTTKVYPAFKGLKEFMVKEYIPQAREFIAFSDMPMGKEWYAYYVKATTTTEMSPDQLHNLGLKEVERITGEMNKILEKTKFKGDLQAFNKMLKTDKRFYYTNPEDVLAGYRDIAKRIDAELPKYFKTLPRLTYGVRAIPEYQAKSAPAARYMGGSLATGRAGWFEANTNDLPSRAKWDMETLTFHEGVPGHHFQIAIAQEMPELPEFRKYGGYTAFSEGWALYAESLGDEMGFYKDPYSKYGNLSAEMMRAVRLVVDTGMHSKGWTKQKSWDYFRSKMPVSDVDSEIEIDRYITWPSQALAYKVGQLKFRQLRELAKSSLGESFDVREFHDEVLRHGGLPMDVLEQTVHEWIDGQKKKAKTAPKKQT